MLVYNRYVYIVFQLLLITEYASRNRSIAGICQKIAKSSRFENITMAVIVIYALYMSVDMDLNTEDIITKQNPVFIVCEQLFCCYFFFELVIRFGAFEIKCNCLKDGWFVFDLALVVMMVAETWVTSSTLLERGIQVIGRIFSANGFFQCMVKSKQVRARLTWLIHFKIQMIQNPVELT